MPLGRPWGLIARNLVDWSNWWALVRAPFIYTQPVGSLRRYVTAAGRYPWRCGVRTPLGHVEPELFSPHDVMTVNEVFCREDYRAGHELSVVVDVGSNIGISALYFLTRSPSAHVRCFEPVPRNVERLRHNLDAFADRWSVQEAAVDVVSGEADFGNDPTGRYGSIDRAGVPDTFRVTVKGINDVLDEVLAEFGRIDVLKIDTEGAELRTVMAIRPEYLERIDTIYFEWLEAGDLPHIGQLEARRRCDTVALRHRR